MNQTSHLTTNQISQMQPLVANARDVVNHGTSNQSYFCIQGTVYRPNGFEKWTRDSDDCGKVTLD